MQDTEHASPEQIELVDAIIWHSNRHRFLVAKQRGLREEDCQLIWDAHYRELIDKPKLQQEAMEAYREVNTAITWHADQCKKIAMEQGGLSEFDAQKVWDDTYTELHDSQAMQDKLMVAYNKGLGRSDRFMASFEMNLDVENSPEALAPLPKANFPKQPSTQKSNTARYVGTMLAAVTPVSLSLPPQGPITNGQSMASITHKRETAEYSPAPTFDWRTRDRKRKETNDKPNPEPEL